MKPSLNSLPPARTALVGALVACFLAGALSAGLTGSAAASSSALEASAQMNLVFTKGSAHLVGSQALVPVRCEGPRSGICNGTAVLRAAGQKHKVPFAVTGGSRSTLTVPLGSDDDLRGKRAVALAKTVQQTGGFLSAREVLRLR